MNCPFSATTDNDFEDSHIDSLRTERRLIRVTTKTYTNAGTYLYLKLFKKGVDEYYLDERLTLTAFEFHHLTNNKSNIGKQPEPEGEVVMPTINREKPLKLL